MSESKLGVKAKCQKLVARAMKRWPEKSNYFIAQYSLISHLNGFKEELQFYVGLYNDVKVCLHSGWIYGSYEHLMQEIETLDVGTEP